MAVCLVVLSLTVALGLAGGIGEWLVRYRERHRSSIPGTMPLLYYRHSNLGYALVRNSDYFGWVHVNSQGFRGPEVTLEKPAGVTRIMAVGGSTTFDSDVTGDHKAWPARLAVHLAELFPKRRFEVINAGVPGYRALADVIRLETTLYQFKPDIIILYQGHNDIFADLSTAHAGPLPPSDTPWEMPTETPWGQWLSRHSLLYGKLLDRWNVVQFMKRGRRMGNAAEAASPPPPDLTPALDRFRHEVESFVLIARESGIRVVLAQPVQVSGVGASTETDSTRRSMWMTGLPFARPEEVLEAFRLYGQVLQEVSARLDTPFISTAQFGLAGTQWYSEGDPIHFNDVGADRMGAEMASAMAASGAFGPPSGNPTR